MKKKLFLFLSIMMFYATSIMAQTPKLVINLNDGKFVEYELSDLPDVEFKDLKIRVVTKQVKAVYYVCNVKNFVYTGDLHNDIEGVCAMSFRQDGNVYTLGSLKDGSKVEVYETSGKKIAAFKAVADVPVVVSLNDFPNGIYFINVNGITHKVIKR